MFFTVPQFDVCVYMNAVVIVVHHTPNETFHMIPSLKIKYSRCKNIFPLERLMHPGREYLQGKIYANDTGTILSHKYT